MTNLEVTLDWEAIEVSLIVVDGSIIGSSLVLFLGVVGVWSHGV